MVLMETIRGMWFISPPIVRGSALVVVSTMAISTMSGIVRHLSAGLHPFEVAFFRSLIGFLILLPLFWVQPVARLRSARIGLQLLRGLLQAATVLMGFKAVAISPLAKVAALEFTYPFFALLLASLVLGEAISRRRMFAVIVGFSGVLLIIRPGFDALDLGSLLALGVAATSACQIIVTRVLGRSDHSAAQVLYASGLMTAFTFLPAVSVWRTPTGTEWIWLTAIGLLGTVAALAFAQSLREAEVAATMPMHFSKLLWAAFIGYVAFDEVPDLFTLLGCIPIIAAAGYVMLRSGDPRGGRDHRRIG